MEEKLFLLAIKPTTTPAYSSESNGLVERMSRTLLDKVRSLLKEANMAKGYWGEALYQTANMFNWTATRTLQVETKHLKLFGLASTNSRITTIGFVAYLHVFNARRKTKLGDDSKMEIYLRSRNGLYRVYIPRKYLSIQKKHV